MSNKDDGGSAFPVGKNYLIVDGKPGISLRDYFAAKALQAIVAQHRLNACGDFVAGDGLLQHPAAPEYAAITAYRFADAMLFERVKP
jgi:hypothetical protein